MSSNNNNKKDDDLQHVIPKLVVTSSSSTSTISSSVDLTSPTTSSSNSSSSASASGFSHHHHHHHHNPPLRSISQLFSLFALSFSYALMFATMSNIVIAKEVDRLASTSQTTWVGVIMAVGALAQITCHGCLSDISPLSKIDDYVLPSSESTQPPAGSYSKRSSGPTHRLYLCKNAS